MSDFFITVLAYTIIIMAILSVAIWIRAEFGDPPDDSNAKMSKRCKDCKNQGNHDICKECAWGDDKPHYSPRLWVRFIEWPRRLI